jgi:hypothetical protein
MSDDLLREFFGDVVFSYTDREAVEDGVWIPFIAGEKDTQHRITRNCWNEMTEHHKQNGYPDYTDRQFHDFYLAELLPLVPFLIREYREGGIWTTDYEFKKTQANAKRHDRVWYLPNEVEGVSMMKTSDY